NGNDSRGTVNLLGGTIINGLNDGSNNVLRIGRNAGSIGTLTMSGGTVISYADLFVGENGTGTLTQTSGSVSVGTAAFHKWAFIGNNAGSLGTYNLSGGNLVFADRIYI